jgi:hypothetical protein
MKKIIRLFILIIVLLLSAYPVYAATQLTWDASTGTVSGYRIYYGTSSGVYTGAEDVGNVTQYPLSNLPLVEETTYYIIVKAYNSAGESSPSNMVTYYCPDSTPPVPPQNLSKQVTSAGNITLAWTANTESDLVGYNVYQGTSTGIYGTPVSLGKVTTYTISGLTQGKTYYFTVTALDDASNESGYSSQVSAAIAATTTTGTTAATTTTGTTAATTTTGTTAATTTSGTTAATTTTGTTAATTTAGTTAATTTPADTTAPTVTIKTPTSRTSYSTKSAYVKMTGSASDSVGVTQVKWVNAANGTNGTASGTTSWTVSSVTLKIGTNVITVTVYDAAGNSSTDKLSITRRR